jgi:hypothetical protein
VRDGFAGYRNSAKFKTRLVGHPPLNPLPLPISTLRSHDGSRRKSAIQRGSPQSIVYSFYLVCFPSRWASKLIKTVLWNVVIPMESPVSSCSYRWKKLANQYSHIPVSRDQFDWQLDRALMADMEDLAEVSHRQIPSTLTLRCIGSSSLINVELASRSRTYKRLRTQGIC